MRILDEERGVERVARARRVGDDNRFGRGRDGASGVKGGGAGPPCFTTATPAVVEQSGERPGRPQRPRLFLVRQQDVERPNLVDQRRAAACAPNHRERRRVERHQDASTTRLVEQRGRERRGPGHEDRVAVQEHGVGAVQQGQRQVVCRQSEWMAVVGDEGVLGVGPDDDPDPHRVPARDHADEVGHAFRGEVTSHQAAETVVAHLADQRDIGAQAPGPDGDVRGRPARHQVHVAVDIGAPDQFAGRAKQHVPGDVADDQQPRRRHRRPVGLFAFWRIPSTT